MPWLGGWGSSSLIVWRSRSNMVSEMKIADSSVDALVGRWPDWFVCSTALGSEAYLARL